MTERIDRAEGRSKRPIARVKLAQFSWATGETAAVEKELPFNGIVKAFVTVVSANTNDRTVTVAIVDGDSYSLYSLGSISHTATTTTVLTRDTEIYVPSGCSVKVTPSDDPGATGVTADVTFYGTS